MPDADSQAGQDVRTASGDGVLKPDATLTVSCHAYWEHVLHRGKP